MIDAPATPAPGGRSDGRASTPSPILGPDGAIARRLPSYEPRPEQTRRWPRPSPRAIENKTHLMVEAGTGVGKSFAYLVPAILAAAESGKKVVVSTHTISLQEQLLDKDLPFLRAVMPQEFSAVLVKGRSNYISLRRLDAAVGAGGGDVPAGTRSSTSSPRSGSGPGGPRTGAGPTSTSSRLPTVWDAVASENGNCLGRKCPRHKDCFYFKARRRMWSANILVVNHALFMSDLALAGGRGEPPARLRRGDLRRGPHARSRRRRAPRPAGLERAGRVPAHPALQRPDAARACSSSTGSTRRCGRSSGPGTSRRDFFEDVADWQDAPRLAERPAAAAARLARHASARSCGSWPRPIGQGAEDGRGRGAADRADRRCRSGATPWPRRSDRGSGRRRPRASTGSRSARGRGRRVTPGLRPARRRADPPPRAVRPGADLHPDLGHAERRHARRGSTSSRSGSA